MILVFKITNLVRNKGPTVRHRLAQVVCMIIGKFQVVLSRKLIEPFTIGTEEEGINEILDYIRKWMFYVLRLVITTIIFMSLLLF